MRHLDLKVGYSCNNNCIHCVIKANQDNCLNNDISINRTTAECKEEILDAFRQGARSLTLTGGEPTIRRDIFDIISYANSLGFNIGMQTNGRAFYYKSFSEAISKNNISVFVIAVHSNRPEIHDKITRKKNSFIQTVTGIRNLRALGQTIHAKIVLSKLNYDHIKDLVEFLYSDLGVKDIFVAFPHGSGNAWKYKEKVIPKYSEIMPHINKMLDYVVSQKELHLELETFPFCIISGYPDFFKELPKEISTVGMKNLDSDTLDWNLIRPMIKTKTDKCNSCRYFEKCEGPWDDYARLYGTDEFHPL